MANGAPGSPATPPPPPPPPRPSEAVGLRVSLIPTEELERKDPKQGFRYFIVAVVFAVVVIGSITGYLWYRVSQAAAQVSVIRAQTDDLTAKRTAIADTFKKATLIQTQVKGLRALLNGHRHATNVLDFLETHTLENVAFTTAALTDDGRLTLSAEARDYESLSGQVVELRNDPMIQSVNISGISATADDKGKITQVNFTLQVAFNPKLFARQVQ